MLLNSNEFMHVDRARVRQRLKGMTTTVSTKGQIVLPASFRTRDKIRCGQRFKVERLDPGRYLLEKLEEPKTGCD